jgi:Na+-driven multidrug efflux pump
MWIVLVLVIAMTGASGINMSIRLGRLDHLGAKQAGQVGVGMAGAVCLIVGVVVWANTRAFGRIFTNDEVFLDMFEEVKTPFTITLVLMNLSVAIEKIPYSMGRTYEVFWYGLAASWGGKIFHRMVLVVSERGMFPENLTPRSLSVDRPSSHRSLVHYLLEG